ncbi:hypothetical protein B566_EDAN008466 [Ephemera danica]|nr:hypothetical protein B566_EDAN008466 [Ephemera danica]
MLCPSGHQQQVQQHNSNLQNLNHDVFLLQIFTMADREVLSRILQKNIQDKHYIHRRIKKEPLYEILLQQCLHQIGHATSDIECICLVKSMLSTLVDKEFDEQVANMKPKDADISELLRQQGNEEYQKQSYTKAHELYTQSIAAAPMKSNQLALGFANRSAVLRAMGKFSESLADIQRAFDFDYPECQRYKLFLRQGQSYRDLGDKDKAAESFKMAKDNLLHKSALCDTEQKRILEVFEREEKAKKVKPASKEVLYERPAPTVSYGQNKVAPSFSSAVDIQYCKKFGRKVVANRDIKIGDILLVENFFGSTIMLDHIPTYCSFCIKRCYNLLPCPNCPYVMYCSEKCRTEAKELYHREECPALCKLLAVEKTFIITENARLTTHAIARAGIKNWQKFIAEQATTPTAQKMIGCNSEGQYLPDDLNALYHLASKPFVNRELVPRTLLALLYMKCFDLENVPNFDEIAASFLRLLRSIPLNQSTYIIPDLSNHHVLLLCGTTRIAGVLSFGFSLINHSCDRNADYLFSGRHIIVRALKPIKKGDQITTSYTDPFYDLRKEQRLKNLQYTYNFTCSCEACVHNYPLAANMHPLENVMQNYLMARAQHGARGYRSHLVSFNEKFFKFIDEQASFHPFLYNMVTKLHNQGKTLNSSYLQLQDLVTQSFYVDSTFYHVEC